MWHVYVPLYVSSSTPHFDYNIKLLHKNVLAQSLVEFKFGIHTYQDRVYLGSAPLFLLLF